MTSANDDQPVVIDGLELDPQRWEARSGGRSLHLTRTEFSLLKLMAQNQGRAFSRDELLDAVWGPGYLAGSNVVDQAVAGLRRKLSDDPRHPTFIETVTGVGYRLRADQERTVQSRMRVPVLVAAGTAVLALAGLGSGLGIWLSGSESSQGEGPQEVVRFHSSARVTNQGEVSGADCSEDLIVSDAESVAELTGDLVGELVAVSTSRLYQSTDCLSGVSESTMVFTDDEENTIVATSQAPIITYRLPDVPDTAVNHQSVSVTIAGGSGKYADLRGEGSCTALSLSHLVEDQLEASSESDCEWTLRFPSDGERQSVLAGLALDFSASPARLSMFGQENGVPSQGRFLAIVRNGGDTPLEDAVLTLSQPEGATIQARATCGGASDELCLQDAEGAPPRGARMWEVGDIPAGEERRFELTMQLLDAAGDEIRVRLELDAEGLAQPLRSREIRIEVVR